MSSNHKEISMGTVATTAGHHQTTYCRMTRSELQDLLKESGYGNNELMFNAYFKPKSAPAQCGACGQFIAEHGSLTDAAPPRSELVTAATAVGEQHPPQASAEKNNTREDKKKKDKADKEGEQDEDEASTPDGVFPHPTEDDADMLILETYTRGTLMLQVALFLGASTLFLGLLTLDFILGDTIWIITITFLIMLAAAVGFTAFQLFCLRERTVTFHRQEQFVAVSEKYFGVGERCWGRYVTYAFSELGNVDEDHNNHKSVICRVKRSLEVIPLTSTQRKRWVNYFKRVLTGSGADDGEGTMATAVPVAVNSNGGQGDDLNSLLHK